ncbi:DUF664 domain-containing protein [Saccharothrix sp.]|uniref:mycothiol transferase n=1 Tax=Saccharothrix sp. TaxID=1873460 RepID=UPI00281147C2|nr:DUF664 domain-containing protein [Saccharothrix sp.]
MTGDTTIHEPSMTAGEVEMMLFALERSRAQFAWKVGGLDAAALRKPHPPSAMTLGGLLKHLTRVEDQRTDLDLLGRPISPPWDTAPDEEWEWTSAAEDDPGELYARWRAAVERSRKAWAEALADEGLDRLSAHAYGNGARPNLRRILCDLHDEYARHTGHADLMREAVDGLVGEDPPR